MSSNVSNPNLAPAAAQYSNLARRLVTQRLSQLFKGVPDLIFFKNQEAVNGLVEYIHQGFYTVANPASVGKASLTIADFNADRNWNDNYVYKADYRAKVKTTVPYTALIEAFVRPETAKAFTDLRLTNLGNSLALNLLSEKFKVLFKLSGNQLTINWDKTIDTKKNANDETDDSQAKRILKMLRNQLRTFKAPALDHTKFSDDNKANLIWTNYTPEDFIWFVNSSFASQIEDLTANLFNKNDVLVKVQRVEYDFSKISGLTNPERYHCVLIHKEALKTIVQYRFDWITQEPDARVLHEIHYKGGFARHQLAPIYMYRSST